MQNSLRGYRKETRLYPAGILYRNLYGCIVLITILSKRSTCQMTEKCSTLFDDMRGVLSEVHYTGGVCSGLEKKCFDNSAYTMSWGSNPVAAVYCKPPHLPHGGGEVIVSIPCYNMAVSEKCVSISGYIRVILIAIKSNGVSKRGDSGWQIRWKSFRRTIGIILCRVLLFSSEDTYFIGVWFSRHFREDVFSFNEQISGQPISLYSGLFSTRIPFYRSIVLFGPEPINATTSQILIISLSYILHN